MGAGQPAPKPPPPDFRADTRSLCLRIGDEIMRLNAPKVVTFWIAVVLAVLGLLASQGVLSELAAYAFWLVLAGFVLLALSTLLKDL